MKYRLRGLVLCFVFITINQIFGQNSLNPIHIVDQELGFRMDLPKGFAKMSSQEVGAALKMGKKQIDQLYDTDVNINGLEPNLFKKDDNNFFIINIKDYPSSEKAYQEEVATYNQLMYNTYQKSFPKAELTEFTETKKIGNVVFTKYSLKAVVTKTLVMNVFNYSSYYKGKDVTLAAVYTDEEVGQEILKAVEGASFK